MAMKKTATPRNSGEMKKMRTATPRNTSMMRTSNPISKVGDSGRARMTRKKTEFR